MKTFRKAGWIGVLGFSLACGMAAGGVIDWSDDFSVDAGPVDYVGDGTAAWTTNLANWSIRYRRQNASFNYGSDGP